MEPALENGDGVFFVYSGGCRSRKEASA